MNILVVEDDKTISLGLEYSLQQEGYETFARHDVQAAKQLIDQKAESLSLCIFDLNLPDGTGYELCEYMKAKADVPVIFLTVMDEEVSVVMGLD